MIKKFLSALLAVLMVVSMVPMAAMAEEPAADNSNVREAVEAKLHDTKESNPYTDDQLNVDGYKVTATKNEKDSTDGVTVYDVTLAHPALLKHYNARKTNGAWIGFGVPAGTLGDSNKYYADGSAFYYGLGEVPADYENVGYMANPNDTTNGYVAGGYLSSQTVTVGSEKYVNRYWDVSSILDSSDKKGFLVVKDPVAATEEQSKSGEITWTYRIYNVTFDVTEGHLVKYTEPTNGTLNVKAGTATVSKDGTPVAKGSDLTITATPSNGYRVKAVKAGDDALTAGDDGKYATKVGETDVTITAEFEQIPTLSATASTSTNLLEKNATDLQAITVTQSGKTVTVTGTSKYVTGYTGFSSDADEQSGNYIALVLKAMKGQAEDSENFVWVKSSKTPASWVKVTKDDNTIVLRVNNYYTAKDGKIEVAIAKESDAPAADAKGEYTIDISSLTLAEPDPDAQTPTLHGIGFQADRVKAYQAMAAIGSGAAQETIEDNTMFARFVGLDESKSYKAEFYLNNNIMVYESLVTADGTSTTGVTGQTTATFYFTLNSTGGSHSLLSEITSGQYSVMLLEKEGEYWVATDNVSDNAKTVSISSVEYDIDGGTGTIPEKTYYEVGTVVTMPAKPAKNGYIFNGWKNGPDSYYMPGRPYTTTTEDAKFVADWGSDFIYEAKLLKGEDEVTTVTVDTSHDPETKTGTITLSGTLEEESSKDVVYKLSYELFYNEGVTEPTPVSVTITDDGNGNLSVTCDDITVGGYTYTVSATNNLSIAKVIAAPSTVDTDSIATNNDIDADKKDELTTALTGDSVTVTDPAPLESAAALVAKAATEADVADKDPDKNYAVGISLKVEPQSYTTDDEGATTLVLNITPVVKLIPIEDDTPDHENAIEVDDITVPHVKEPVTISVKLPTTLATAASANENTLYVKHKKDNTTYVYDGTVNSETGVLTFTNPHGFSTFEITAEGPAAEISRYGTTTKYATLQDAVNVIGNYETIKLLKDAEANAVTVSTWVLFNIDRNGHTLDANAIKAGSGFELDGEPITNGNVTTYKFKEKTPPTPVTPTNPTTPTTYAVKTPSAIEGGKVSASAASAAQGATVTLTVTPDEGYELDKLTVTDASGKAVSVTGSGSRYTFTMPGGAVTVSASFKKAAPWQNPFDDIKESAWYYDAVKYVKQNKLMNGNEKGQFEPDKDLTRAEFAAILYNKEGQPATTWSNVFTDVPEGAWFAKQVVWAANQNILAGYGDGKAGPNDPVKREELAVLLWKYEGRPAPKSTTLSFPDADKVSSWAKDAMLWAVENGVISGTKTSSGTVILDPQGSASRAESAQMLMNHFSKK